MWVYFLVSVFRPLPHLAETLEAANPPKVENGASGRSELLIPHSAGKITFLLRTQTHRNLLR